MRVKIAFAAPTGVWQQALEMPDGSTAGQALAASEFARRFSEYTDQPLAMGVYGERCDAARVLREGDRLELCRSLVFDPMVSRRRRAEHRKGGAKGR